MSDIKDKATLREWQFYYKDSYIRCVVDLNEWSGDIKSTFDNIIRFHYSCPEKAKESLLTFLCDCVKAQILLIK